jgi:hypothetical protein
MEGYDWTFKSRIGKKISSLILKGKIWKIINKKLISWK